MILFALGCTGSPDTGNSEVAEPQDTAVPCAFSSEADGALYVDPLAPDGGDGSLQAPLNDVNQAVQDSALVRLLPGDYGFIELLVHRAEPVVVEGACRDGVLVNGGDRPGVYLQAGSTTQLVVRSVRITGDWHGAGVWRGHLRLEDVLIHDVFGHGVYAANGATADIHDSVVDGVAESVNGSATGLVALDGGTVFSTNTRIFNAEHSPANSVGQGSEMWLERFQAHDGPPQPLSEAGGVIAQDGGFLSCTDCVLTNLANAGFAAIRGGEAHGQNLTIRGVHGVLGSTMGLGGDGVVLASDVRIQDIEGIGVASVEGGYVVVEGVEIVGMSGTSAIAHGMGLSAFRAELIATDVRIRDVQGAAIEVDGGVALVTDLTVDQLVPGVPDHVDRMAAPAVLVSGGTLSVQRGRLNGAVGFAVSSQEDAVVLLEDVVIDGTAPFEGEDHGVDLVATAAGTVWVRDVQLLSPTASAAGVLDGTLLGQDLVVGPSTGVGLGAYAGGWLELQDVSIDGRTGIGVGAIGENGVAVIDGLVVRDTARSPAIKIGLGIAAYQGGSMDVSNVHIQDTEGVGIVSERGAMTCAGCTVDGALLAGVLVENGTADIDGLVVRNVHAEATTGLAVGVAVNGTDTDTVATLMDVDLQTGAVALMVVGATVSVQGTLSSDGPIELLPGVWTHGDGIYVAGGTVDIAGQLIDNEVGLAWTDSSWHAEGVEFVDNGADVRDVTTRPNLDPGFLNVVDLDGL